MDLLCCSAATLSRPLGTLMVWGKGGGQQPAVVEA